MVLGEAQASNNELVEGEKVGQRPCWNGEGSWLDEGIHAAYMLIFYTPRSFDLANKDQYRSRRDAHQPSARRFVRQ